MRRRAATSAPRLGGYWRITVRRARSRKVLSKLPKLVSAGEEAQSNGKLPPVSALVAQGIEHGSPKAGVAGSNPAGGTLNRGTLPGALCRGALHGRWGRCSSAARARASATSACLLASAARAWASAARARAWAASSWASAASVRASASDAIRGRWSMPCIPGWLRRDRGFHFWVLDARAPGTHPRSADPRSTRLRPKRRP